jgi:hypothetical protein
MLKRLRAHATSSSGPFRCGERGLNRVARRGVQVGLPKIKADKPPRAVTLPGADSECALAFARDGCRCTSSGARRLTHEGTVRRTVWDVNKTQKQNFAAIGLSR